MKLNKKSKVPLYQQLKEVLLDYITNNLEEGDMLPIEIEIEQMYSVSRATVRGAIEALVKDGVVVKVQGKGTIVKRKKVVQEAGSITSWTEEMKEKGKKIKTLDLQISEIEPSKRLMKDLSLEKGEKIIRIKRIRSADDEPISILVNYLRAKFIPNFIEKGLTYESLYEQLEKEYDLHLDSAHETIKAEIVTDLEAEALNIEPYSSVLKIRRCSYLNDGTPFEIVEMTNRSDRYEYFIELKGRKKAKILTSFEEEKK